jgi:hypothetical protein
LSARITGAGRTGAIEEIETGDILSLPETQIEQKSRLLLNPSEVTVSLPTSTELPNAVAPLTSIIGSRLTTDSPAWKDDPIPGMRMLQKTLVATSLQLGESDRKDLLVAIEMVEKAVQMRLRWQQMCRSEAEGLIDPASEEKTKEEKTKEEKTSEEKT